MRHVVIILNVCTLQSIVRCENTAAVFVHHKRILLERSENYSRFRWPRDLRRGLATSRLQTLRVCSVTRLDEDLSATSWPRRGQSPRTLFSDDY